MTFTIKGEQGNIVVDIKRRNYPDSDDYWDGNWLNANITVTVPGYHASFNSDLRAEEIRSFLNDLTHMNQSLNGHAKFHSMEEMIQFDGQINKVGQIEWKGRTTYPAGTGTTLSFNLFSDQSFLTDLICELEAVVNEFPMEGNP